MWDIPKFIPEGARDVQDVHNVEGMEDGWMVCALGIVEGIKESKTNIKNS